jgi:L-lactate dehydrogenase complex protein LldG
MNETFRNLDQNGVLDDIRRALRRSLTLAPTPLGPFSDTNSEVDLNDLVACFTREAAEVGAQIHRTPSGNEATERIADICASKGVGEVALSGAELFTELNLSSALAACGLSTFGTSEPSGSEHEELIARLANCEAGVTAADFAIAETGTIVLSSEEQNALLVSLLPPVHIAVLRSSQIMASLGEVISKLHEERMGRIDACRSVSFITGPSRTSDVELVLSIGVHGPKELYVIILE